VNYIGSVETAVEQVLPHLQENDLVITLGAGTITTLSDKIFEALGKSKQ
jgi:UDP-N-acetylmuramate-alanine ligase